MAEVIIKSQEQLRQEWNEGQQKHLAEIRRVLRLYDIHPVIFLAEVAAGLCGVDTQVFLTGKYGIGGARQARWLFLYAYRSMTHDTYAEIVRTVAELGMSFSPDGIRKAVEQIESLILSEPRWKRRWIEMQKAINIIKEEQQ